MPTPNSGTNNVINAVVTVVTGVMGPSTSYDGSVLNYVPLTDDPNKLPIAWVYITGQREVRWGLGGQTGGTKHVEHDVVIEIKHSSHSPSTDEATFRQMLDDIRVQLRVNQPLSGVTLRFGESMQVEISVPDGTTGAMHYHAIISSTALEELKP